MAAMKVLIADQLAPEAKAALEKRGLEAHDRAGIEGDDLKDVIFEFDGLIVRGRTEATADLISAGRQLKAIGRAGVGVDNIDLKAAKAAGIAVVNTPAASGLAVAEHTMALMLAIHRNLVQADQRMKAGEWPKKEYRGAELAGKNLGIMGIGNIGKMVAHRAAAFGMRVLAYDPFFDEQAINKRGAEAVSLAQLYKEADTITFHLPLTDESRGMVDAAAFKQMKRGVFIVHPARGGVIDEGALLSALNSGQVAGAGIDVFESEPPGASDLVKHPKVIATPHIAAQSAEAQIRVAVDVAEEVANVLLKKELRWQVA